MNDSGETSPIEEALETTKKAEEDSSSQALVTTDAVTAVETIASVDPPAAPLLSKNQMKRTRRYQKILQVKQRRKEQDKQARLAKALAQGRDLEAYKRDIAERTRLGEGNKRRREIWEQRVLPIALQSFQVCLDCSFESHMTTKEINSLASQIRYCYSGNNRSSHPCRLHVTDLNGTTRELLENVSGFSEWHKRAFTATSKSLAEHFKDNLSQVVYLTSDSETTLTELDNNKIYVIGGIVDRNRLKQAAHNRARELGVATAKLPLEMHLQKMKATRVLTCNHVFAILLRYRENGHDWKQALLDVLPHRKEAKPLVVDSSSDGEKVLLSEVTSVEADSP